MGKTTHSIGVVVVVLKVVENDDRKVDDHPEFVHIDGFDVNHSPTMHKENPDI